ncbi:MAG: phosphoribosylanthranilate isomerase [Myxococcota bacterium]
MSFVKVCGITRLSDLEAVIDAGADAVGINIWPGSPRSVGESDAAELVRAARGRIETVLVVVDHSQPHRLREQIGADWVQLHGDEPSELVSGASFKAIGIAGEADVALALGMPGERLLVDARDPVRRGGTGERAPTALAREIAAARRTILAGGLRPDNVEEAIRAVRPWGVDTASGVESAPGEKDRRAVETFVRAAKHAFSFRS